jgi:hypothetical protein
MVALDLEASPVAGQIGSAVLDLQGNVLSTGTDHRSSNVLHPSALQRLYQMLLEVGSLQLPSFRRMTVAASNAPTTPDSSIRYIVSRDEACIYIIAQRHPS